MSTGQALEKTNNQALTQLSADEILANEGKIYHLCEKLAKSGDMIPCQYQGSVEKIFAAVTLGLEVGLKPMQALRSIYVVNGVPTLYGDSMLALVKASGELESIKEYSEGDTMICEVVRRGEKYPVKRSYSEDDAAMNPNSKNPTWKTHRKRMKQMRARTWALRDAFPDVLMGLYAYEEKEDIISIQQLDEMPVQKEDPAYEKANELMDRAGIGKGQQIALRQNHSPEELIKQFTPTHEPKKKKVTKKQAEKEEPQLEATVVLSKKALELKLTQACELAGEENDHKIRDYMKEFFGSDTIDKIPPDMYHQLDDYLSDTIQHYKDANDSDLFGEK
jgi:hypothetical protein